jgi:hypothetical protein
MEYIAVCVGGLILFWVLLGLCVLIHYATKKGIME